MHRILIIAGVAFFSALTGYCATADAADMPVPIVKAPPVNPFAYPAARGFYFGVGTVGGGGKAEVNVPGLNSASLVTNQIGVAGIVGYVWGVADSPMFVAIEEWLGWNNVNGSAPGFSFSGPAQFTTRLLVGAPTDQICSVIAVLSFLCGGIPTPPFILPSGQSVLTSKAYIGGELTAKDVSANINVPGVQTSARAWDVVPAITVGFLNVLTKGSVIDAAGVIEFDEKGHCFGGGMGCGKLSTTYLARIAFKW